MSDFTLTKDDQTKIMAVAKDFAGECEKQGLGEEETKELVLEVMKATAEVLREDREKK